MKGKKMKDRQMLYYWRNGQKVKRYSKKFKKEYWYIRQPELIEGEHYNIVGASYVYTRKGQKKIKELLYRLKLKRGKK